MNSLSSILLEDLISNLSKKNISILEKKGKSVKEILIHDYLSRKDSKLINEPNISDRIIDYAHKKSYVGENKYLKFMTPKKKMVFGLYEKELSEDYSWLYEKIVNRTDMKQLLCFDEVCSKLSDTRRSKINTKKEIYNLLSSSLKLLKGQREIENIRTNVDQFKQNIRSFNYNSINHAIIKNANKEILGILEYTKIKSDDFEAKKELAELNNYIETHKQKTIDGVKLRLERETLENKEFYEQLQAKKYFTPEEGNIILNFYSRAKDLTDIVTELSIDDENKASEMASSFQNTMSQYTYFSKNKNFFSDTLNSQKNINNNIEKISKLNFEIVEMYNLMDSLKKKKNKIKKNYQNMDTLCENIYLKNYFEEKYSKDILSERKREHLLNSRLKGTLKERINSINLEEKNLNCEIEKRTGFQKVIPFFYDKKRVRLDNLKDIKYLISSYIN